MTTEVTEKALTVYDASTVATSLSVEQQEELIRGLSASDKPLLLWLLDDATKRINVLKKIVTLDLLEHGRLGEEWTSPEGEQYRFEQTKRGEFDDLPGLFYALASMGATVSDLARCTSGARVTDLEALASRLPEDVRQDALETVRAHRVYREGTARLEAVENKYRRKK